jgi:hypothetical protein
VIDIALAIITACALIFGVICAALASRISRRAEYLTAQLSMERRALAQEQSRTMQMQRQMRKAAEGQR